MERNGIGGGGLGMKLAQNKVSVGHSRKLINAKDLTKKLTVNMAVIFGVRVDEYSSAPPPLPP